MIDIDVLSELIANIVSFFFSFLNDIDLSPIATAFETLTPFFKAALYILPAKTIAQIFSIICAIWSLRFIIKTLRALWSILPIL